MSKWYQHFCTVVLCTSGLVSGIHANELSTTQAADSAIDVRQHQRDLFLDAEEALKRRQLDEYARLNQALKDYPLQPYLEADYIRLLATPEDDDRVLEFLSQHHLSPLGWQVRSVWLDKLMDGHHYEQFLRDYEHPGSTRHQCFSIYAQLATGSGDTKPVLRRVNDIWLTGESLPKDCDPVLEAWTNAGMRTTDMVWQRIALAAEGGKHTLIPYLQKMLPTPMHYLSEHYHRVRRNPSSLNELKYLTGDYPELETQIVAYGLGRLIWRDPDIALKLIDNLPAHINFSADQYLKLRQTFAVALSVKGHEQAGRWLARIDATEHTDVTLHWQLAEWLRQGAWTQIMGLVPRLPDTQRESEQWQYWFARSLEALGFVPVSKQVFERVAQQRSYYGFLAAAKLKQPLTLSRNGLELPAEQVNRVRQLPGVQRAYELRALDRNLAARREWNALLEHLPPNDQRALAVIASEWGWHDQAIYTLGLLGEYDAIAQRFPTAYMEEHQEFSNAANIDVNWALAVSRRESAFRNDARSHAGAYGLMQLLPSTANLVERRDVSVHELFNPSYNIRLGTRYLADLQRRLGNNWILATAAYNAGIYRVYDWLPAQPMEADRWIELIPYVETRNYVKNVLAYQQIYRSLRENELQPELFGELVPMQISGSQLKP
ncbi:transglycosylase SLT domain-containing protein [Pseudidiomarina marina]|uniref:Murein transglycosylase n=1 Tax=Pseudidiomarina marina TaxID=502366 RepID=A0A432YGF3_9GAMM|nr:transglycosylase SLT domain-containing protein [Pseudidiomarina marina]RUO60032.1 murein transglycosylase [Pseudidiomarina marina]